jgi:hypothetical protein
MARGTVRIVLDLHFDGTYYKESERADTALDWIYAGLDDRSDLVGTSVVEAGHSASTDDNFVMLNGTRYEIKTVEDSDTLDVVDGVAHGYLTLACSYPITEENAS